jgi:hypothetical protein
MSRAVLALSISPSLVKKPEKGKIFLSIFTLMPDFRTTYPK